MTKILTFKKRKDFLRVAKGFYVATHNMVLQATRSLYKKNDFFVGYTATKKIGNAVIRNLSKRRLRAVARENLIQLGLPNVDYVFIAKKTTHSCNYEELTKDVIYAIKKINKNFNQHIENNSTSIDGATDNNDNNTQENQ